MLPQAPAGLPRPPDLHQSTHHLRIPPIHDPQITDSIPDQNTVMKKAEITVAKIASHLPPPATDNSDHDPQIPLRQIGYTPQQTSRSKLSGQIIVPTISFDDIENSEKSPLRRTQASGQHFQIPIRPIGLAPRQTLNPKVSNQSTNPRMISDVDRIADVSSSPRSQFSDQHQQILNRPNCLEHPQTMIYEPPVNSDNSKRIDQLPNIFTSLPTNGNDVTAVNNKPNVHQNYSEGLLNQFPKVSTNFERSIPLKNYDRQKGTTTGTPPARQNVSTKNGGPHQMPIVPLNVPVTAPPPPNVIPTFAAKLRATELREVAAYIEPKHEKEVNDLIDSYNSMYSQWLFALRCGFALLMYGFGSKKALIEDFATRSLTEHSVVVVNGYLQSINLKQLVITLAELLWEQLKLRRKTISGSLLKSQQPFNTRSMDELLAFLDRPDLEDDECFVCIVIHNIEGPGLRDSDRQLCLARVAACSHVRMVASIDHVNAPLLWDKKMVHTQFNWCWCHVPTFAPYKVEAMFFPFILAHGGTAQSVKTASIVLQSLTPNAQNVFKVLAEHQLAHADEEGMPINNLYTTCRERFLVSSQVTMNSHLTEFKDHELIKTRRNSDGQDCLNIPLTNEALQKLIAEII